MVYNMPVYRAGALRTARINERNRGIRMKNVLVVLPLKERHREKLEKAGEGCAFLYVDRQHVDRDMLASAEVIIGNVPAGLISASDRLELLQLESAGADAYIKPGALSPKTILCNATGAYGKAVSEHALAMTLMLIKKLHLYRDAQDQSRWSDFGRVSSISGAVVAVMGLGDIGLRYARMAKALGAYTIGLKRRGGPRPDCVDELYSGDGMDQILARADIVASFLPGTAETAHVYSLERFRLMKPTAVFINCGRGNAVAADVLAQALNEGLISAAGVDVTEQEPLPGDSPLWKIPNLMISPHVSGYYHLPDTLENVVDIAAANLAAFLQGKELRNIVDLSTGYRK